MTLARPSFAPVRPIQMEGEALAAVAQGVLTGVLAQTTFSSLPTDLAFLDHVAERKGSRQRTPWAAAFDSFELDTLEQARGGASNCVGLSGLVEEALRDALVAQGHPEAQVPLSPWYEVLGNEIGRRRWFGHAGINLPFQTSSDAGVVFIEPTHTAAARPLVVCDRQPGKLQLRSAGPGRQLKTTRVDWTPDGVVELRVFDGRGEELQKKVAPPVHWENAELSLSRPNALFRHHSWVARRTQAGSAWLRVDGATGAVEAAIRGRRALTRLDDPVGLGELVTPGLARGLAMDGGQLIRELAHLARHRELLIERSQLRRRRGVRGVRLRREWIRGR